MLCGHPWYQLHHRTYSRLGRENLLDLLPLCRDCHELTHRQRVPLLHAVEAVMRDVLHWSLARRTRAMRAFGFRGAAFVPKTPADERKVMLRVGKRAYTLALINRLY